MLSRNSARGYVFNHSFTWDLLAEKWYYIHNSFDSSSLSVRADFHKLLSRHKKSTEMKRWSQNDRSFAITRVGSNWSWFTIFRTHKRQWVDKNLVDENLVRSYLFLSLTNQGYLYYLYAQRIYFVDWLV